MPTAATITAIAPWYGSKRNLAPAIVHALGPHRCYVEPFCGSMAVLLAKPPTTIEIVNDLHTDLVNLARCIACPTAGPQLYRRLRRSLFCEQLLHDAAAKIRAARSTACPQIDPDRAYWFFLFSWMGRNGIAGQEHQTASICARFNTGGGSTTTRWKSCVNSIPTWKRRLANVQILNRDAFAVLESAHDGPATAIYCDPPYLAKTKSYIHDFTPADHRRLAAALGRFRQARVVVSYYDHPDLADLYPDWTIQRIEVIKALSNATAAPDANRAVEVLLINRPHHPQLF